MLPTFEKSANLHRNLCPAPSWGSLSLTALAGAHSGASGRRGHCAGVVACVNWINAFDSPQTPQAMLSTSLANVTIGRAETEAEAETDAEAEGAVHRSLGLLSHCSNLARIWYRERDCPHLVLE